MKPPRFGIAWLMGVVAIVAMDFGSLRQWSSNSYDGDERRQFLIVGALPMANVLAIGLLIGRRRLWWRPFLLGFETFGAVALAFYVSATIQFGGGWLYPYLDPVLAPVADYVGRPVGGFALVVVCCAAAIAIIFPQLAFAFVGGLVFRWLRRAERSGRTPD